jgi:hypothetical protein
LVDYDPTMRICLLLGFLAGCSSAALTPQDLGTDGAADLAQPDMTSSGGSSFVWPGGGGNGTSPNFRLNFKFGGTDVRNRAVAPSGASFTPGKFSTLGN